MFHLQTVMLNFKWFLYTYVLVLPIVNIGGSHNRYKYQQDSCDALLYNNRRYKVVSPVPPVFNGEWTSSRCEIRPGPEFVLRKYQFRRGKFQLHQYYYDGPDCSRLLYGVSAQGTMKRLRQSWIVTGGTEAKYRLHNVSIIPYTPEIAHKFQINTRKHCKELKKYIWKPFKTFQIMNFPPYKRYRERNVHDFDCTKVFNLTFHELQLVRVEIRKEKSPKNKVNIFPFRYRHHFRDVKELFLGDIHTNNRHRQTYRPSNYQPGLRPSKTKGCRVCSELANSNDFYPPELKPAHKHHTHLTGEWLSTRCETRQYGQFLTRHLIFLPDGKSWQGTFDFFEDPVCLDPSFSLAAKGNYVGGKTSTLIDGAREYSFRVTRLKITPKNRHMTNTLNMYGGNKCGKSKSWKMGDQQDVTSTGGCVTLGIILPNIEYDIIRTVKSRHLTYLYVGQRPSDSRPLKTVSQRPTSFQDPLVKCSRKRALDKDSPLSNELPRLMPRFERLQSLTGGSGYISVTMSSISIATIIALKFCVL